MIDGLSVKAEPALEEGLSQIVDVGNKKRKSRSMQLTWTRAIFIEGVFSVGVVRRCFKARSAFRYLYSNIFDHVSLVIIAVWQKVEWPLEAPRIAKIGEMLANRRASTWCIAS